jgi:hypothetical protein
MLFDMETCCQCAKFRFVIPVVGPNPFSSGTYQAPIAASSEPWACVVSHGACVPTLKCNSEQEPLP